MKNFLFGFLFLAVGIGVSIFGKGLLSEARESEKWPSAQGVIVLSEVEQSREYDSSKKKTKTVYRANIDYSYAVDGKTFFGDKISFGGTSNDRKAAYKVSSTYPKDKSVQVYYQPGHPENSVLEPGVAWTTYIPFLSGLLFALVGGILALRPLLKLLLVALVAVSKR